MQQKHFETALSNIAQKQEKFHPEAFLFLRDALDYTVSNSSEQDSSRRSKHVTATDLLVGIREYALQEYGPMAATLLAEWGVTSCSDIGDMVFMLIEEGIFGKQDSDQREDFMEIYSFHDAFVAPFLPKRLSK